MEVYVRFKSSKFYSTYCFKLWGLNIHKSPCNRAIAEIHVCLVLPDHFRNQVEDKLNQSCLKFKIYKEKYFIHIIHSKSQKKKNCQEEKQPERHLCEITLFCFTHFGSWLISWEIITKLILILKTTVSFAVIRGSLESNTFIPSDTLQYQNALCAERKSISYSYYFPILAINRFQNHLTIFTLKEAIKGRVNLVMFIITIFWKVIVQVHFICFHLDFEAYMKFWRK